MKIRRPAAARWATVCTPLVLLLACGPAELRGPASAVDIQARIDAPTASVHDEAAVRAVLGRGVAVGSAQGGGFQLTIVVANIERFGLPTGPGGGVCPDPDLATTAAVEAHYDTLQTALTEMHDADLSLTIDQGFTQDCQLSDASDAIAKWRFVAHHAIMGSSYTSQVSASVCMLPHRGHATVPAKAFRLTLIPPTGSSDAPPRKRPTPEANQSAISP